MRLDRASVLLDMLLILVAVAAHQVGAGEFAFLLATVILCAIVWRRSALGRPLRIDDTIATLACMGAFVALMLRGIVSASSGGYGMADVGVGSVGDFLIVYEWIALCRRREGHDDFWMYMVTLVLMGTAGLEMPGLGYGFFFIVYTFVAVCALAAHYLAQESSFAAQGAAVASVTGALPGGNEEPQARLGRRFFLSALLLLLPLLAGIAGFFALMPRTGATGTLAPIILRLGQQPVSGFTNTVRLGSVGQIQDNPTRVMHVVVRDPATQQSVQMESLNLNSLLLRGLPLDTYSHEERGWSWVNAPNPHAVVHPYFAFQAPRLGFLYQDSFPGFDDPHHHTVTCDITLEPISTSILFVPFAPERISAQRPFTFTGNTWTHELVATGPFLRRTPLNYTVTSRLFDPAPPRTSDALPSVMRFFSGSAVSKEELAPYLALPDDLSPRIRSLARNIVPASARTDYEKAGRILDYLSDPNRFSYTTLMQPTPGVEPVEDFLFNLHRGHCEYFASSMVILLREARVPARLVNGFKVSEWNPIVGSYVVRQQHAHSWVEAYLSPYGWRTFDPSVARDSATPQPMFARRIGRNVYDWVETAWVSYVLNFDAANQQGLYGALGAIGRFISRYTLVPLERIGSETRWSNYESPRYSESLDSFLRFVLWSAAIVLAGAFLWTIARRLWNMYRREWGFYLRMEQFLAQRGRRRAPSETPWEFSARLAAAGWPSQAEVAAITEQFCRARYGGLTPTEAELRKIEQALRAIRRTPNR